MNCFVKPLMSISGNAKEKEMPITTKTEEKFFGGHKGTATNGQDTGVGHGETPQSAEENARADLQNKIAERQEQKNNTSR